MQGGCHPGPRARRDGLALGIAACTAAVAHPLDPALLDLEEVADGGVRVLWKVPNLRVPGSHVEPVLPGSCRPTSATEAEDDGVSVSHALDRALRGGIDWRARGCYGDLGVAGTDALVRVALADGRLFRAVVSPRQPQVTVPERPNWRDVFRAYARMGTNTSGRVSITSSLSSGLILLVSTTRLLIETITAFTVGHSLTLSLAALGVAPFPQRPMEVLIALTIFVLAVELARETDGADADATLPVGDGGALRTAARLRLRRRPASGGAAVRRDRYRAVRVQRGGGGRAAGVRPGRARASDPGATVACDPAA